MAHRTILTESLMAARELMASILLFIIERVKNARETMAEPSKGSKKAAAAPFYARCARNDPAGSSRLEPPNGGAEWRDPSTPQTALGMTNRFFVFQRIFATLNLSSKRIILYQQDKYDQ